MQQALDIGAAPPMQPHDWMTGCLTSSPRGPATATADWSAPAAASAAPTPLPVPKARARTRTLRGLCSCTMDCLRLLRGPSTTVPASLKYVSRLFQSGCLDSTRGLPSRTRPYLRRRRAGAQQERLAARRRVHREPLALGANPCSACRCQRPLAAACQSGSNLPPPASA